MSTAHVKIVSQARVEELVGAIWADSYIYGGAVRDRMLGLEPRDYDYLCIGDYDEVYAAFGQRGLVLPIGKKHGTFVWESATGDLPRIEISVARELGEKLDSLDFTINAMIDRVYSLKDWNTGFLTGSKDLESRILRPVNAHSLKNDPIRTLRGIRFRHKYGLDFSDPITVSQFKTIVPQLILGGDPKTQGEYAITPWRSWTELKKIYSEDSYKAILAELEEFGLDLPIGIRSPSAELWHNRMLFPEDHAERKKVYKQFKVPKADRNLIEQHYI